MGKGAVILNLILSIILCIFVLIFIFVLQIKPIVNKSFNHTSQNVSNLNSQQLSNLDSQNNYNSLKVEDNCINLTDNYVLPDFDKTKQVLENQQIVKDTPSGGKINLKFYHFVGDCRKFDKIYLLGGGTIKEENVPGDIELLIKSDYANEITDSNLCEVVQKARANGDLEDIENAGDAKLLWVYGGMLKYKDCLGL
jgi:hypothetical protein